MKKKYVKCPNCDQRVEYTADNAYRPFCSERCQTIDLGDWASEKYAIPVAEPDSNNEKLNTESTESKKKHGDEDGEV